MKNKIALVTGGSRGLGRDMAISLAKKGLGVILTYNAQKNAADATVSEIEKLGGKAAALQLNVENAGGYESFFHAVERLLKDKFETDKFDFLVNNAGVGIHASFAETTEEQFDSLVNIHFKAAFFLTQKALPWMADGGGIVNLSSGLARFSFDGYSAYGAMKGAIDTLTRYQAKELGARKIRANSVAPGAIETDFGGGSVRDVPQVNQMISSQTALGRAGLPDDVGSVVAFLCTDDAKWINGQRIEITGGFML
jgi:NAD(P)-dependent dehydrogenase (short-subunit alcohol dehydrogenase family)